MGVFIINNDVISGLQSLREHAEANPFTVDMLMEIEGGKRTIPGDTKEFSRILPGLQKVVLTIELQEIGKLRHMSMSTHKFGKLPHRLEVEETMKALGFESELSECRIDLEEITPGHHAISVIEIMEPKQK